MIAHNERVLIIDIGEGRVLDELGEQGVVGVSGLLFTHHHRDLVQGAYKLLDKGVWIGVPADERMLFEDADSYWKDLHKRWHLYYFRPNYVLTQPLPVDRGFKDRETFSWGPAHITVVSTPGHTDDGVSYLVDVDGRRFAFCGDLIYDNGKILEIYSLQKGFGELTDYHGFMFAWREVVNSLKKLIQLGAEVLIPSRGNIIHQPKEAVELLEQRLKRCYENYLSTSALWHYFPTLLSQLTSGGSLGSLPTQPPPSFLRHIGTSWILLSKAGSALITDCGSEDVIKTVEEWLTAGEIRRVEALWVTHTHDDHTEMINEFRQRFGCEVIAEESVANIISYPSAWKLPCLSPNPVPVDRVVKHGESWPWNEFVLTAYHFPGQSLYHSGLLVEGRGLRLFFLGDSLTPTGLDDYCSYNRNFLGRDEGYDFCLRLLEKLRPVLLFNSHIDKAFALTPADLKAWRRKLRERERILRELFPWNDPNYGIDPYWAFCFPYEQKLLKSQRVEMEVVIRNHSHRSALYEAKVVFPSSWGMPNGITSARGKARAREEIRLPISFTVPSHIPAGRYVLLVDVKYDEALFPCFGEFIVEIEEKIARVGN